jgi:hypothetical protein
MLLKQLKELAVVRVKQAPRLLSKTVDNFKIHHFLYDYSTLN